MRVMLALGGNAMTSRDGRARPDDQIAAARIAMAAVADLLTRPDPVDVVLTHGNGPQVGNLLVKNELAAGVVPPVPLDWCGAQTQATLGNVLMNALDDALRERGASRPAATLVTRTLVDRDDPGFTKPTKPIGRFVPEADARQMIDHGEVWEHRGEKGWRRVVASPEPREILDAPAVLALIEAGFVVVAAGGGGIPSAALLARTVGADALVVATDVPNAMLHYGTSEEEPIGRVTVSALRAYAAEGHFAGGSMGPKVEAALRFVDATGKTAVITDLDSIIEGLAGTAGTVVVPD
jgi:carbamate kinase